MRRTGVSYCERIPLGVRLLVFRLLERFSEIRRPSRRRFQAVGQASEQGKRWIWVYVTTIGELNAVDTFLGALLVRLEESALVLITNHGHYRESFLKKFPAAAVETVLGTTEEAEELARQRPPCLLVVAEIPCLLHDAPCRFSFATVRAARRCGAPAIVVNGWLYGYAPPSRMDRLENALFKRDYVRSFSLLCVQTEQIRDGVVRAGADERNVVVTGNFKFDTIQTGVTAAQAGPPLAAVLASHESGPIVVAGSVTEVPEQRSLLAAFAHLRREVEHAVLITAPRHPENQQRMSELILEIRQSGLGYKLRSELAPGDAMPPVLVLDSIGELRFCYSLASIAYVGADHNVLEPLQFGVPVFVAGRWEPTYPSYPVFRQTVDAGLVIHVEDIASLGATWIELLGRPRESAQHRREQIQSLLRLQQGACDRALSAMQRRGLFT